MTPGIMLVEILYESHLWPIAMFLLFFATYGVCALIRDIRRMRRR